MAIGTLVCGATILGSPIASSALESGSGTTDETEVTGEAAAKIEEAALVDWYVKEHDVSAERARADLKLQEDSHDLRAKIWDVAKDNLAQIGLEEVDNRLAVVAYVTKAADHDAILKLMEESGLPSRLVTVETPSMDSLAGTAKNVVNPQLADYPQVSGTELDGAAGAIRLIIRDASQEEAQAIVDKLYDPNLLNGARLTYALADGTPALLNRGGYDLSIACTQGFSVKPTSGSGSWGTTTASHCGNSYSWRKFSDPTWHGTSFQDFRRSAKQDVQWSTISGGTPNGRWYGSSTTSPLDVTATLDRSAMNGDVVCHRGESTDWSCGTVSSITYAPSNCTPSAFCCGNSDDAVNDTACDNEWPRVAGANLACWGGDSGGPWANVGTAYGMMTGGATVGMDNGDCFFAWFSPARKVGLMDMEILLIS